MADGTTTCSTSNYTDSNSSFKGEGEALTLTLFDHDIIKMWAFAVQMTRFGS